MLISIIPFIVFIQVWFLRGLWILHNKLYTIITPIKKSMNSTCHRWSYSIAYNVVCVPNNSVPPYSLTPTYLERVGLIPQLKMILMYCVKCQWRAECWFIFFSFQLDIWIPVRMDLKCKNNPDMSCYIYGNVVLPNRQAKISDFVKKAFHYYFGVKVGNQDKPFASHVCCKTCIENLRDWRKGERMNMPFMSLMLRNEDFLLTHPVEVSKQFFYVMRIVFLLSLLGIQYKWKKL